MKIPVLVTRRLFPDSERLLSDRFRVIRSTARAAGALGALVQLTDRVDARFFDRLPALRVVSQCAVGVDNIDLGEAARRGIAVMNTPGVLTEATADHTWALILAAARRVVEGDRLCRAGRFRGWDLEFMLGADVSGSTLGIVGPGRIGTAVARRAAGFGMTLLCHGRRPLDRAQAATGMRVVSLARLLARSDIVTLHVPASAATRHMIGAPELARMKPGAILVNTSRGTAVDEKALVTALRAGRPGGAALDVFEREPAIPAALKRMRNVVLTPHVASATHRTRALMAGTAARNLVDYFAGRPAAGRMVVKG
ncbi:MAG: 2-hydroxyacid dehydrogenase [Candidatus Polarisedimenticolia bacterium]